MHKNKQKKKNKHSKLLRPQILRWECKTINIIKYFKRYKKNLKKNICYKKWYNSAVCRWQYGPRIYKYVGFDKKQSLEKAGYRDTSAGQTSTIHWCWSFSENTPVYYSLPQALNDCSAGDGERNACQGTQGQGDSHRELGRAQILSKYDAEHQ